MTIDEAIAHAREVAEEQRKACDLAWVWDNPDNIKKCAEEHEQLAKWLEELKQYRAIGTLEECRALKDRLVAKKVSLRHVRKFVGFDDGKCPTCGESVSRDFDGVDVFCPECGQRLDWSDEE